MMLLLPDSEYTPYIINILHVPFRYQIKGIYTFNVKNLNTQKTNNIDITP